MIALLLAACTPEPTVAEERAAAEAVAEALVTPDVGKRGAEVEAPVAGPESVPIEPVEVVLVWEGIGALHKGFFTDMELYSELTSDLTGHIASPVDLYIRYDSADMIGDIRLRLAPGALARVPSTAGDRIDLQALAPLTTALASYRSSVAARFDFRVESFRVGVESYRGHRICSFSLAGEPPPDGRLLSPCVEINGQQECGVASPDGVVYSPEASAHIRACLDIR
ncbi:MAG: hypothetical protein P8R54_18645 [Myxococcota bacterium]|nr:hypothetical protein [Myxococcota bacterium]